MLNEEMDQQKTSGESNLLPAVRTLAFRFVRYCEIKRYMQPFTLLELESEPIFADFIKSLFHVYPDLPMCAFLLGSNPQSPGLCRLLDLLLIGAA